MVLMPLRRRQHYDHSPDAVASSKVAALLSATSLFLLPQQLDAQSWVASGNYSTCSGVYSCPDVGGDWEPTVDAQCVDVLDTLVSGQCAGMLEAGYTCEEHFCPSCGTLANQCDKTCRYGTFCSVCGDCRLDSALSVSGQARCDDGNTVDGDGCSSTCFVETGWTCSRVAVLDSNGDTLTYENGLTVTVDECIGCSNVEGWADNQGFTCEDYEALGACDQGSDMGDSVSPGGRAFSTEAYYNYVFAQDIRVEAGRPLVLLFDVAASNDAHVYIGNPEDGYGLEVVLGGWNNEKSVIRKYPGTLELTNTYGGVLGGADSPRSFWLMYNVSGEIAAGAGNTPLVDTIVIASDVAQAYTVSEGWNTSGTSELRELYITTGWGSTGEWDLRISSGSDAFTFESLASGGLAATDACCQCGGGEAVRNHDGDICSVPSARLLTGVAASNRGPTPDKPRRQLSTDPPALDGSLVLLGRATSDGFTLMVPLTNCVSCSINAIVVIERVADRISLPVEDSWPQIRSPGCRMRNYDFTGSLLQHQFTGCSMTNGSSYAVALHVEDSTTTAPALLHFTIPKAPIYTARSASLSDLNPVANRVTAVAQVEGAVDEATIFQYRLYWGDEDGNKVDTDGNQFASLAGVVNTYSGGGLRSGSFNECPFNDCNWELIDSRTTSSGMRMIMQNSITGECMCYRDKVLAATACPEELLTLDAEDVQDYMLIGEGTLISMGFQCYKTSQWRKLGTTAAEVRQVLECACSLLNACVGYHLDPRDDGSTSLEGALIYDSEAYGADTVWPAEFPSECLSTGSSQYSLSRTYCDDSEETGVPTTAATSMNIDDDLQWSSFLCYQKVIRSPECLWTLSNRIINSTVESRLENVYYGECLCQVSSPPETLEDGTTPEADLSANNRLNFMSKVCSTGSLVANSLELPTAGYCEWTNLPSDPTLQAPVEVDALDNTSTAFTVPDDAIWLGSKLRAPAWELNGTSSLELDSDKQVTIEAEHTFAVWVNLVGLPRVDDPHFESELLRHSLVVADRDGDEESCLELLQRSNFDKRVPYCTDGGALCTGDKVQECCSLEDSVPSTTTTITWTTTTITTTTTRDPYYIIPYYCKVTCDVCPTVIENGEEITDPECADEDEQIVRYAPQMGLSFETCAAASSYCVDSRQETFTETVSTTTTTTTYGCSCKCGPLDVTENTTVLDGDKWSIGIRTCGTESQWDSGADVQVENGEDSGWKLLVATGSGKSYGLGTTEFYISGPEPADVVIREATLNCSNYEVTEDGVTHVVGCIATAEVRDIPPEEWRTCGLTTSLKLNPVASERVISVTVRGGDPQRTVEVKRGCLPSNYGEAYNCTHRVDIDEFVHGVEALRSLRVDVKLSPVPAQVLVRDVNFYIQEMLHSRYLAPVVGDYSGSDLIPLEFVSSIDTSDPTRMQFVAEFLSDDYLDSFYLKEAKTGYYLQPDSDSGEADSDGVAAALHSTKDTSESTRSRMQFTLEWDSEHRLRFYIKEARWGRYLQAEGGEASSDGVRLIFSTGKDTTDIRGRMQYEATYQQDVEDVTGNITVECRKTTSTDKNAPASGSMRKVGAVKRTCAGATLRGFGGSSGGDGYSPYHLGQAWFWNSKFSEEDVSALFYATRTRYYPDYQVTIADKQVASAGLEVVSTGDFSCTTAGCEASVELTGLPSTQTATCLLYVDVAITDFGLSNEVVEYIRLDDIDVVTDCWPGADDDGEHTYACADGIDVSQTVLKQAFLSDGTVTVTAKISAEVDSYAVDGKLLAGTAEIRCAGGSLASSTTLDGSVLLDTRTQAVLVIAANDQGESDALVVDFTDKVNGFTTLPYTWGEPSTSSIFVRFEAVYPDGMMWLYSIQRKDKSSITREDVVNGLGGDLIDGGKDLCSGSSRRRGSIKISEYLKDSQATLGGCDFEDGVPYSVLVYVDGSSGPYGGGTIAYMDFVGPTYTVSSTHAGKPLLTVRASSFTDEDLTMNSLSGTIRFLSAYSEDDITEYWIFFAKGETIKDTTPVATVTATNKAEYTVEISNVEMPSDVGNFLFYTVNDVGRSRYPHTLTISDLVVAHTELPTVSALTSESGVRIDMALSSTGIANDIAILPKWAQTLNITISTSCPEETPFAAEGIMLALAGTTAGGAPFYAAVEGSSRQVYLYYEPNCDGAGAAARWTITATAPNTEATFDLDGDLSCTSLATIPGNSSGPPLHVHSWTVDCDGSIDAVSLTLTAVGSIEPISGGLDFPAMSSFSICTLSNVVKTSFVVSPCTLDPGEEYAVVIYSRKITGECICASPCTCLGAIASAVQVSTDFEVHGAGYISPVDNVAPTVTLECGDECVGADRELNLTMHVEDPGHSYPVFVLCAACRTGTADRPPFCVRPGDGAAHAYWRIRMESDTRCKGSVSAVKLFAIGSFDPDGTQLDLADATVISSTAYVTSGSQQGSTYYIALAEAQAVLSARLTWTTGGACVKKDLSLVVLEYSDDGLDWHHRTSRTPTESSTLELYVNMDYDNWMKGSYFHSVFYAEGTQNVQISGLYPNSEYDVYCFARDQKENQDLQGPTELTTSDSSTPEITVALPSSAAGDWEIDVQVTLQDVGLSYPALTTCVARAITEDGSSADATSVEEMQTSGQRCEFLTAPASETDDGRISYQNVFSSRLRSQTGHVRFLQQKWGGTYRKEMRSCGLRHEAYGTAGLCRSVEDGLQKAEVFVQVQSSEGIYVWLGPEDIGGIGYEIVLGGGGNTRTELRKGVSADSTNGGYTLASAVSVHAPDGDGAGLLTELAYTNFWISADPSTGLIRVGEGDVLGHNVLIDYMDPFPLSELDFVKVGASRSSWREDDSGRAVEGALIKVCPIIANPARNRAVKTSLASLPFNGDSTKAVDGQWSEGNFCEYCEQNDPEHTCVQLQKQTGSFIPPGLIIDLGATTSVRAVRIVGAAEGTALPAQSQGISVKVGDSGSRISDSACVSNIDITGDNIFECQDPKSTKGRYVSVWGDVTVLDTLPEPFGFILCEIEVVEYIEESDELTRFDRGDGLTSSLTPGTSPVQMTIGGLSPNTWYEIFCYAEDFFHNGAISNIVRTQTTDTVAPKVKLLGLVSSDHDIEVEAQLYDPGKSYPALVRCAATKNGVLPQKHQKLFMHRYWRMLFTDVTHPVSGCSRFLADNFRFLSPDGLDLKGKIFSSHPNINPGLLGYDNDDDGLLDSYVEAAWTLPLNDDGYVYIDTQWVSTLDQKLSELMAPSNSIYGDLVLTLSWEVDGNASDLEYQLITPSQGVLSEEQMALEGGFVYRQTMQGVGQVVQIVFAVAPKGNFTIFLARPSGHASYSTTRVAIKGKTCGTDINHELVLPGGSLGNISYIFGHTSRGCTRTSPSLLEKSWQSTVASSTVLAPTVASRVIDDDMTTCIETGGLNRTIPDSRAWWRTSFASLRRVRAVWLAGPIYHEGNAGEVDIYGMDGDEEFFCATAKIGDSESTDLFPPSVILCESEIIVTQMKVIVSSADRTRALVLCEVEFFTTPVPVSDKVAVKWSYGLTGENNTEPEVCGAESISVGFSDDLTTWTEYFPATFTATVSAKTQSDSVTWWEQLSKLPFNATYDDGGVQKIVINDLSENTTYDIFCWGTDSLGNDISEELVSLPEPWSDTSLTEDTDEYDYGSARRLQDSASTTSGLRCAGTMRELFSCEEDVLTTDQEPPVFVTGEVAATEYFYSGVGTTAHVAWEMFLLDGSCELRVNLVTVECRVRCAVVELRSEGSNLTTCSGYYCNEGEWYNSEAAIMAFPNLAAGGSYTLACQAWDPWNNTQLQTYQLNVPAPTTVTTTAGPTVTGSTQQATTTTRLTTTTFDWDEYLKPVTIMPITTTTTAGPDSPSPSPSPSPVTTTTRAPTPTPSPTPSPSPTLTPRATTTTLAPTTTTKFWYNTAGSGTSTAPLEQSLVLQLAFASEEEASVMQRPAAISACETAMSDVLGLTSSDTLEVTGTEVVAQEARRLSTTWVLSLSIEVTLSGQAHANTVASAVASLSASSISGPLEEELAARNIDVELTVAAVGTADSTSPTPSPSPSSPTPSPSSPSPSPSGVSTGQVVVEIEEESSTSPALVAVVGIIAACAGLSASAACGYFLCRSDSSKVRKYEARTDVNAVEPVNPVLYLTKDAGEIRSAHSSPARKPGAVSSRSLVADAGGNDLRRDPRGALTPEGGNSVRVSISSSASPTARQKPGQHPQQSQQQDWRSHSRPHSVASSPRGSGAGSPAAYSGSNLGAAARVAAARSAGQASPKVGQAAAIRAAAASGSGAGGRAARVGGAAGNLRQAASAAAPASPQMVQQPPQPHQQLQQASADPRVDTPPARRAWEPPASSSPQPEEQQKRSGISTPQSVCSTKTGGSGSRHPSRAVAGAAGAAAAAASAAASAAFRRSASSSSSRAAGPSDAADSKD